MWFEDPLVAAIVWDLTTPLGLGLGLTYDVGFAKYSWMFLGKPYKVKSTLNDVMHQYD